VHIPSPPFHQKLVLFGAPGWPEQARDLPSSTRKGLFFIEIRIFFFFFSSEQLFLFKQRLCSASAHQASNSSQPRFFSKPYFPNGDPLSSSQPFPL